MVLRVSASLREVRVLHPLRLLPPRFLDFFRALVVTLAVAILWNAQPIAIASIHLYQRALSPAAARIGLRCRFTPTCSRYAETVIARDGALRGGWLALKRVARCNPLTPAGTRDEP